MMGIHQQLRLADLPMLIGEPSAKQCKLTLKPFDGKEVYRKLGPGFDLWSSNFYKAIHRAQMTCGFQWPEQTKCNVLMDYLEDKPREHFQTAFEGWFAEEPTLIHSMDQMFRLYAKQMNTEEIIGLFTKKKWKGHTWIEHLQYLMTLNRVSGGKYVDLITENLVNHAKPELKMQLTPVFQSWRSDVLVHAQELLEYIQMIDKEDHIDDKRKKNKDKIPDVIAAVEDDKKSHEKCEFCGKTGHASEKCWKKPKDTCGYAADEEWVLFAGEEDPNEGELIEWVLDSGSSNHYVVSKELLTEAKQVSVTAKGAGGKVRTELQGRILMETPDGVKFTVSEANYSPDCPANLLSYVRVKEKGLVLQETDEGTFLVKRTTKEKVIPVHVEGRVLRVKFKLRKEKEEHFHEDVAKDEGYALNVTDAEQDIPTPPKHKGSLVHFHQRMGHLAYDTIVKLAKDPNSGIELTDTLRPTCITCAEGKQAKNKQPDKDSGLNAPTDRIGGVICSDLKGPMTPADRLGNRYMVVFVDHFSNYTRVFLAKDKTTAADKFQHFMTFFERTFNCKIHVLRTDGGKEYRAMDLFCERTGIHRQKTEPYTPASNGKAERMHRTLLNMARTMIFSSKLPLIFWGDAIQYACYILNRSPSRSNPERKPPMQMLTGKQPNVANIVTFGAKCTVHIKSALRKTWDFRATVGYVVGISEEVKGYRVYIPKKNEVTITQHVKEITGLSDSQNEELMRQIPGYKPPASPTSDRNVEENTAAEGDARGQESATAEGAEDNATGERVEGSEQQLSKRQQKRKKKKANLVSKRKQEQEHTRKYGVITRALKRAEAAKQALTAIETHEWETEKVREFIVCYVGQDDPKNYREAKQSKYWSQWKHAMQEEIDSLNALDTWELVRKDSNMCILHTKWVYKTKTKADGSIERYKARAVVRGDEQIFGVNYSLTFAPVMTMSTAYLIFALAIRWGVPPEHGDIPNAYVRAQTEDGLEIYLQPPTGMEITDEELKKLGISHRNEVVLKLKKSLYGLKQAGRLWNELLDNFLISNGFQRSSVDMCLYFKKEKGEITVVGIYVDDLLVTGTSKACVDKFFQEAKVLDVKALGVVSKFLGMRVTQRPDGGLDIDQESTIEEMLEKFGLKEANRVLLPIGINYDQESDEDQELLPTQAKKGEVTVRDFQSMAGSLLWVARCTRPDIMFAVHSITRKTHAPTVGDLKTARKIMRYLRGTSEIKLEFAKWKETSNKVSVSAYSDADWADNRKDRKSVTGGLVLVDNLPVAWMCRKQNCVALSTLEAEYIAASEVTREMLGIKQLLQEIGQQVQVPMPIWIDNKGAISQIEQEASSAKLKHVDLRLKFLSDRSRKQQFKPTYVKSEDQVADLLTKPLPQQKLIALRKLCRLSG